MSSLRIFTPLFTAVLLGMPVATAGASEKEIGTCDSVEPRIHLCIVWSDWTDPRGTYDLTWTSGESCRKGRDSWRTSRYFPRTGIVADDADRLVLRERKTLGLFGSKTVFKLDKRERKASLKVRMGIPLHMPGDHPPPPEEPYKRLDAQFDCIIY